VVNTVFGVAVGTAFLLPLTGWTCATDWGEVLGRLDTLAAVPRALQGPLSASVTVLT
jgi:hypothetical protein